VEENEVKHLDIDRNYKTEAQSNWLKFYDVTANSRGSKALATSQIVWLYKKAR